MSEHSNEEHSHDNHAEDHSDHTHNHTHEHSHDHTHNQDHNHEHGHNHGHGHQDPFANPSKTFIWKYAFRNYIRRRSYYKELMKQINPKGSEIILDFGSGTGTFAKKLAPKLKTGQLYCLDTSENFLEYTKNQLKKFSNVEYLLGEIMDQKLSPKSFDCIVSTWVLHHLDKDILTQTIKGFKEVLKDNGTIFIIEFPEEYEHAHHIHSVIKTSEILDLFSQNNFSNKVLLSKSAGVLYKITN